MSRVALLGESWFTYSVHQKGFDAFYTSEYVEGGDGFIAALHDAATRSRAFPHLAPPGFTQWSGYGSLFDHLVRWVAREDLG